MPAPSPILQALARLYSESKAGRTGSGRRDFLVDFKKLLAAAGCQDGDEREMALRDLRAQDGKLVALEGPLRDTDIIHQVRFSPSKEAELFALLGELEPSRRREALARQFEQASQIPVPPRWLEGWRRYCRRLAEAARSGGAMAPFSREDSESNAELLALARKLLLWQTRGEKAPISERGAPTPRARKFAPSRSSALPSPARGEESLLRFASCVLCGDSKRLSQLAAKDSASRHRGKLGSILEEVTGGEICCLEEVGIVETPRFALVHGPLRLLLEGEWLNLDRLRGPLRISDADLERAEALDTSARRCLTVENETSFHELAKLQSGELLVCTSYPGAATVALLQGLPARIEFWHFGDTDPEGFDILRDLRERTGRPFRSLHMRWRPSRSASALDSAGKRLLEKLIASPILSYERETLTRMLASGNTGQFEQESLGRPTQPSWPFYAPRGTGELESVPPAP